MNSVPREGVSGPELAELFRKAIRHEVKIAAIGNSWKDVYAGDVRFRIGEYTVTIFNDCNELDYVDSAIAPDGREGDFDAWYNAGVEPVSLLTDVEHLLLENLLERAKVEGDHS
jgi:hypothetical protein